MGLKLMTQDQEWRDQTKSGMLYRLSQPGAPGAPRVKAF